MPAPIPRPSPIPSRNTLHIIHAYRHLLRTSLQSVHYSTPARYTIRWRLRLAFRSTPREYFDPARIRNTLQFIANAKTARTLEHKVFRTLLHTWFWEEKVLRDGQDSAGRKMRSRKGTENEGREARVREGAMDGFRWLVRGLNESLGMCIR